MRTLVYIVCLCFCLAHAQDELIGTWIAGDDMSSLRLSFAVDEVSMQIIDAGEEETYLGFWYVEGSRLRLNFDGEDLIFTIVSLRSTELILAGGGLEGELYLVPESQTQQAAEPNVVTNPQGQAEVDVFTGLFIGNDMSLELNPGGLGYEGTLSFQGQVYPARAEAQGNQLLGIFTVNGQDFEFDASLNANILILNSGGSSFQLEKQAQAANPLSSPTNQDQPPTATPSSHSPQADANGLFGKWRYHHEEEFLTEDESLYLLPDGRYFAVTTSQVPGYEPDLMQEEGLYEYANNQLLLKPFCGAEDKRFDIDLQANQLSLSGRNVLDEAFSFSYVLEAGVEATVAEIQELDAQRLQTNQAYLARTPVGAVQTGQFAQAGLPVDPNPTKINPSATVFTEGELYTFISEWSYVFDIYGQLQNVNAADIAFNTPKMATLDYNRGTYRDTTQWFFLPSGRFYSLTEIYGMATSLDPLTPQTSAFWGTYHIEGDQLFLEEDTGAVTENLFIDGRRAFLPVSGGVCYKEVTWATEQLEQQTEELGN